MPFDPNEYLKEESSVEFDPNAYLADEPVKKKASSEATSGVPTLLKPPTKESTLQSEQGGLDFSQTPSEILAKETPKEVETPKPSVNKNKFEPTIADVNKKITEITLKQKYPEYGEFKSFAEASKQAISEEQKQAQLDAENRSKERRLKTIPAELQELREEKKELLLKKDYPSMKKLQALDAVERRYEKLLKENEPKSYADISNLNKDVIKGMEDEVHQYINLPENKYIKEKIALRGLTDIETNEILLAATEQKTKPIIADIKQLTNEGIVDIAKQRMEMSKSINAKQDELKNILLEIDKIEESELDKKGFKELNVQINKERGNLDKLKPLLAPIEGNAKLIAKERAQIETEIKQFDSKINGNQWLGTEQELKKYKQLFSDYNVLLSKEKEIENSPELISYNKQIGVLNSLLETKKGLVKGLEGTKHPELVAKYDLIRNDINNIITKYQETDSPEINQKLNQFYTLTNQLDKATEKYEGARGRLVSLDELDRAKKEIENDPNYATDFGARALNSIADFGKGLAAFPFSFAASLHSDGGYHYSDAVSDLIQGKGMEKGFLINKNESLINPETGKANWGVIPIINSIGDNLGTLLGFATTGRYLTPIVAGEVAGASSTIMEAQKATEIAKAYTTIVPAYMSSYSGALDEAKELGFQGKGAFLYANAIGFLNGVSEMILPDQDLVFGKGVKTKMLKEFIENYAKNPTTAVKDLTTQFVKNGLGGASEEWIVMLGETAASSLGHLADSDIKAKIPTIDEIATTGVSSFVLEGGMGMIGQYSENKTLNRLGKLEFAKDFENGKLILDGLKERGAITDDKYNKLVSDIQKYQSVIGQVPDGISDFKKIAIIEKMLDIKAIKENLPKEKSEVFEKIANKKINEIQTQIEAIIDDKDFDKNEEKKFRSEIEKMVQMANESAKSRPAKEIELQRFTSPTEDNYGTINRNDGKGIVTLTKEEYLNEVESKISNLEKSIDNIDNEQSKAVVYEQVNELNKEKAEILKREIKQENEIRSTDNNIPQQVESPPQEIKLTPIEVIAGKEQGDGGVAKVVQGDGQGELALKTKEEIDAKKADIERRKQDALKSIKQNGNTWEATVFSETGFKTGISHIGGTREDILNDIEKRFWEEELKAVEQSNLIQEKALGDGQVKLEEPSAEQQFEDVKNGNVVTFEYKNESEVPEVFKDKISSSGEINGKKSVKVTMAKSLADFYLQKTPNLPKEKVVGENVEVVTPKEIVKEESSVFEEKNKTNEAENLFKNTEENKKHNALKEILKKAQIPFDLNVSYKNGSHYWTIDGVGYRVADHAKPKGSFGYETYKSGDGDFRSYDDFYDFLSKEIDLTDKSEAESNYKKEASKFIEKIDDTTFKQPDGTLFGTMEGALNNMWMLKKEIPSQQQLQTPKIETNDKENKSGVQSNLGKRKEPKQAESNKVGSQENINAKVEQVEGQAGKESAELRAEEEALDTRNAKEIGDIQINDINLGNVVIGYHATPTGEIGTGKELGIHIGTEDVSNNIKKGRNADKGDVKKVAFRVNKPLILGDMPSWSSVNVLNEMMRLKLLGIDKEKIRDIRDSDLSEKEKQQRAIELAKENGYDSFAYQNFDEGNGEFSYVLFDDSKLNDITPKEAKATPQEGSVVGASLRDVELKMRRPEKNEVIFVSVDALLQKHAADQPSYDVQKEGNRIKGRVEKAKEFIKNYIKDQRAINPKTGERMNTKVSFEPSVVDIDANGKISFEDGRHRVLAAKEMGLTEVPIEVPKERVKAVEQSLKETPQEVKVSTPEKVQEEAKALTKEEIQAEEEQDEMLLSGESDKRRRQGKFTKDGITYVRQKETEGVEGSQDEVVFAKGVTKKFKYKVIDRSQLQPSHLGGLRNSMHFIPEAQPKRRTDSGSIAAEQTIANNPNLKIAGENTNAYSGAPVVNKRGEVIQGNNRAAGLVKAYKQGTASNYKQDLINNAEKYGMTKEQVEAMEEPVLVRELDVNDTESIELGNYEFNDIETGNVGTINPVKIVSRMTKKIKEALVREAFKGEYGTTNESIRGNFDAIEELLVRYLNVSQYQALRDSNKNPSTKGIEAVNTLLQRLVFDGGDVALSDMFEGLPPSKQNTILKAAVSIISLPTDITLLQEFQNAIVGFSNFVSRGTKSVDAWSKEYDAFTNSSPRDIYTPLELEMIRLLSEKPQSEFSKMFKDYSVLVKGKKAEGMWGEDVAPITKAEAVENIFKIKQDEQQSKESGTGSSKKVSGEKAEQEQPQTPTEKAIDVYKRLSENNDTSTRKEYKALPESIKRVLDNIVNIHQQLEQKKIITKKGNCP